MIRKTLFLFVLLIGCLAVFVQSNPFKENNVNIELSTGRLSLQPLNQNTARVRFIKGQAIPKGELIYTEDVASPAYKAKESNTSLKLLLKKMIVVYDKQCHTLTFTDVKGQIVLQEKEGGRLPKSLVVQGEPTFLTEQHFLSPVDEYLFGTKQFQDGYSNVRGLSRRLTQANIQITIPFILSNKGYDILWNNYGLIDSNPIDESVKLLPVRTKGRIATVGATSIEGNKHETRLLKSLIATFSVPADGQYGLLLDVGQRMACKHYIAIDGNKIVGVNNLRLPPTISVIVELSKGERTAEVRGVKEDSPVPYWRQAADETVLRSPVAHSSDYTIFSGNADEIIAGYHQLTGKVPMLPLWALGYTHRRERYNTQAELLKNAHEFRKRKLPADVIVQNWQWWGKYGQNVMQLDESKYPSPGRMVRELHNMSIHLMLSAQSKIDKRSALEKQMESKGFYIPGTDRIDLLDPDTAAFY